MTEKKKATERTRPVGKKPTQAKAKHEDTTARTAGLTVPDSGPGKPPPVNRTTTSHTVLEQAKQNEVGVQPTGQPAPVKPDPQVKQTRDEDLEERKKVQHLWTHPPRAEVNMTVDTLGRGAITVQTEGSRVYVSGNAHFSAADTFQLIKTLQQAFQAVS